MTTFSFADAYRASGLPADAETLRLRQAPFAELRKSINAHSIIDLSRLYFALAMPGDIEWFRTPFADADTAFSMVDNANEVAALAACLLEAAFEDGHDLAALTPLALAAFGARGPAVRPALLSELSLAMARSAIQRRTKKDLVPDRIKVPTKNEAGAAIEALAKVNDWATAVDAFRKLDTDSQQTAKMLAEQMRSFATTLADHMDDLHEQVEMLWWHVGGWSRVLNQPFSALPPGKCAVLAGLDMADLCRTPVGPVALPAILHRTLTMDREHCNEPVTIRDVVGAFAAEDLKLIELGDVLRTVPDICPVLTAMLKAKEMGVGDAWHEIFTSVSGLPVDTSFSPTDLAIQVFREHQILASLLEA